MATKTKAASQATSTPAYRPPTAAETLQAGRLIDTNPLLAAWKKHGFKHCVGLSELDHEFDPDKFMERAIKLWGEGPGTRKHLCSLYSWAIPTKEVITELAARVEGRDIVEIGAGRGYWARMLSEAGCTVHAYDNTVSTINVTTPDLNTNHWMCLEWNVGLYYPVQYGDQTKAGDHPDATLFLCWPPYDDPMAALTLKAFRGNQLIVVGEGKGGCCAGQDFWDEIDRKWIEEADIEHRIPTWPWMRDYVQIYRRKPSRRFKVS